MKKALTDVPVLLIFFTRPDTFKKVFEKVKEARPSKLFLACDGPRENRPGDIEKINECKKIAEDIDWECEVHTDYSEKNLGCGIRPQSAISWALGIVDRIVILEDDCVPDVSFFGYMAELLEKYKDDERIGMVCGLNLFQNWDCGQYSYFFSRSASIWGWGTWRRVWKDYDFKIAAIKDSYTKDLLQNAIRGNKRIQLNKIHAFENANAIIERENTIHYWDFQFGFLMAAQSYLSIVPATNLIANIGVGEGATHSERENRTKWKKGKVNFIPQKAVELPLQHPPLVIEDVKYAVAVDQLFSYPNFFRKNFRRAVRFLEKIRYLFVK